MDTLLLRFRNLKNEIDTINEHIQIIEDNSYTWWGWWKKSKEENKKDVLTTFKKSIKSDNSLEIGLFNRDDDKFYSAQLIEIITDFRSKIDCPEKSCVPSYYRNEKLHCWFKIHSINQLSKDEFKAKFKVIPTIEDTLYALPYSEKIENRYEIETGNILHLSDLHFGSDFGFPLQSVGQKISLLDRLKNYFELENKIKIDIVIVSGDITSRGDIGVLQSTALNFFNDLCRILNIQKQQLIIVPGNHDIPLKNAVLYDYNHENGYKIFLKELYGEKKEMHGYDKFITKNGLKIDILRINSIKLRNSAEKNYGYVGWDNYRYIIDENISADAPTVKIAVLHHHLMSMSTEEQLVLEDEFGSVSVTLDAGKVIEGLQSYNFDLVLHGHQHIPGINKVYRGMKNGTNVEVTKGLLLSGAGSAGAKVERLNDEFRDNAFTLIQLENDKMLFKSLQFNTNKVPTTYFDSVIEKIQ